MISERGAETFDFMYLRVQYFVIKLASHPRSLLGSRREPQGGMISIIEVCMNFTQYHDG